MTTLAPLDAYRLLAEDYDRAINPLLALERTTLAGMLPELVGKFVLDAAAGTGYWAEFCVARGARALAVDFCAPMLMQARCMAVLADVARLPIGDKCVDVTICALGLGYAPSAFAELARVTKRGGTVLVSDVHPEALRRGWTRSFRHAGETIGVRHIPYSLEDLTSPALVRTRLEEPCFGADERALFEQAGKADQFEAAARHPAIYVARWKRV